MKTWQPIATAPKDGTIIRLRDANKMYNCVMAFNQERQQWEGMAFSMLGSSKTYWDESFCAIAEWQELS